MAEVPQFYLLNNGLKMPAFGLGTYSIPKDQAANTIQEALHLGYRHIDCAHIYGNEAEIGLGFEKVFGDASSGIKREDVWVTSKLWRNSHKKDQVKAACQLTLKNLRLKYLDLYLIHVPVAASGSDSFAAIPLSETWAAMEELVREGLVKTIGVSNVNCLMLHDLTCHAKITPAVNQVERHPYLVQPHLMEFAMKRGIHLTAYSSLGSPEVGASKGVLLEDPVVKELSKKYSKTPAQILLNWALREGTSVIPKSTKKERLLENKGATEFSLSNEDVAQLRKLDRNIRYFTQLEHGVPCFW